MGEGTKEGMVAATHVRGRERMPDEGRWRCSTIVCQFMINYGPVRQAVLLPQSRLDEDCYINVKFILIG